MGSNKDIWEEWGERDPYFAVVTVDQFRVSKFDDDAKRAFFETGRKHVEEIWPDLAEAAGGNCRPVTAIDYGCGVGRILLPLAQRSENIVGVDVSSSMLEEAKRNAEAAGLTNIDYFDVDGFVAGNPTSFDLVHTYIVLQHIPVSEGYGIIAELAGRLSSGGVGMIHLTYMATGPVMVRMRFRMYRDVPGLHRAVSKLLGRRQAFIPVYEYDLDRVRRIFEEQGCSIVKEKDTDHGFLGKMFFIRKSTEGSERPSGQTGK